MTDQTDPTSPDLDPVPEPVPEHGRRREAAETQEFEELSETAQDEYPRPADDEPGELSIDDTLEADRVRDELPESRNVDGYRFDETRDRGLDESAAAEQGNRDEDRMVADGDIADEVSQLAGSDTDAVGTDRDLSGPADYEVEEPEPQP